LHHHDNALALFQLLDEPVFIDFADDLADITLSQALESLCRAASEAMMDCMYWLPPVPVEDGADHVCLSSFFRGDDLFEKTKL